MNLLISNEFINVLDLFILGIFIFENLSIQIKNIKYL
jgi:hypothetical protein